MRSAKHIIALTVSLFLTFRPYCALETLDTLGFSISGYDGTFDRALLRERVFDLGKLKEVNGFQIRDKIDAVFVDSLKRKSHTEEGFNEFTTSLKPSISIGGKFSEFKSNVAARYSTKSITMDGYYFSCTAVVITRAEIYINTRTANLSQLVIPDVRNFIETASPVEILLKYGTHVSTGVIAGGVLELWTSGEKSQFSSLKEFSASVSAKYKKLVQGSAELTFSESELAERSESREGLIVRGGYLRVGRAGEDRWANSTETNAETIKFLPGGAVPIWDLIEDADQKESVRQSFELFFGGSSLILKRFSSIDINSTNRQAHPEAQVYVEKGWKVISGGADVRYYGDGQLLTKSYPIITRDGPIGWKVASKDHLESDPGRIQAFAIAAWDPFNALDIVMNISRSSILSNPTATAPIPSGYAVVGGGADVHYIEPGSMLVRSYPSTVQSWNAMSKSHLQHSLSHLDTYAIGGRYREGPIFITRIRIARFGPARQPSGVLRATTGHVFLGAGAQVSRGGAGNMLVSIVPSSDGKEIYASSKDHLKSDPQQLTIYGIEIQGGTFVRDTRFVTGLDPNSL